MKRIIPQSFYNFLSEELKYLESVGKLQKGQANDLMQLYDNPNKSQSKNDININIIHVLLTIGSILIGLGILTFVASNWSHLTSITKYIILLAILIIFFIVGKLLEVKKPTLSKTSYYIGVFAFGGELFYIGQLFHLGIHASDMFLAWGIGTLPLAYYLKDKYLKGFSLALVYIFVEMKFIVIDSPYPYGAIIVIPLLFLAGHYMLKEYQYILKWVNLFFVYQYIQFQFYYIPIGDHHFPWIFLISIPILFFIGHRFYNKSLILFIINTALVIEAITSLYSEDSNISNTMEIAFGLITFIVVLPTLYYVTHRYYEKSIILFTTNTLALLISVITIYTYFVHSNNSVFLLAILFVLGMILYYQPFREYDPASKIMGAIIHFSSALALSFPDLWESSYPSLSGSSIPAVICLVLGVAYCIYALILVAKNNLLGVFIISIFVFRFYVDLSLQFMSKSIAFILGGILLIVLGYWFERTRKGGKKNEKTDKE
ncbi:DUF2157 domain-containing protein [Rummeliibacillus pycnus]|uniref:DUF2157 domain-containing protein n=1 Tax=Rummeliibacillus pycnus TaxID=101070 RepID=UPI003D2D5B6E